MQVILLVILSTEAVYGTFEAALGSSAIWLVMLLIACEGLSGGYSYCSAFSRIGEEDDDPDPSVLEFKMAACGFADSSGIVAASFIAGWLEPTLCAAQVARGKTLCEQIGS